jgi:hypothetical protein
MPLPRVSRAATATAIVLAVGLLLAAGAAAADKQPSTIYLDKQGGYRITVPKKWQVVPPSLPLVKQRIAQLKKQKKTELAAAYSSYISTAAARKELTQFRFRAFLWPALPSPVPTDVSLSIQPVAKRYRASDLPAIGAVFAKNLASPGSTVSKPQLLDLPAGKAVAITGTVPLPKQFQGAKTGFMLILLLRPGRLYLLSFRIDSSVASEANVFTSIAKLFRFV